MNAIVMSIHEKAAVTTQAVLSGNVTIGTEPLFPSFCTASPHTLYDSFLCCIPRSLVCRQPYGNHIH